MYKMVAIDLDDTLLKDDHTISELNKQAIRRALEKGIYVIIASGRATSSVKTFMEMIHLKVPIAAPYNGARVIDIEKEKILYKNELSTNQALPVISEAQKAGYDCIVYVNDIAYVKEWNKWIDLYKNFAENVTVKEAGDLLSQIAKKESITKVLIVSENSKLVQFEKYIKDKICPSINTFITKPEFLEFNSEKGTKGEALKFLSSYLDIKREEIIAIGDSYNDISMIEFAGLGVAVENGYEDVKKIADYITLSNEKDGVAHIFEKFIL